jgi:hypothetical protein
MCDELPSLHRELESGWNGVTPARQQRVGRRLVERVLDLDDRKPPNVGGLRDRPSAQPDANTAFAGFGDRPLRRQAATSLERNLTEVGTPPQIPYR